MIRRQPTIISIADEKQIAFLVTSRGGQSARQICLPLDNTLSDGRLIDAVPKWVRQATHQLMVVPDYWIGNKIFEFHARKRSIITAFIERKLLLEQPNLTQAADFYDYAMVRDQDRRQMLYCTYLQESMAYTLYRRLESLGISPHRISTPALIWQSSLSRYIDGFAEHGIGFVHLTQGDCFLYFYHMGQFLFSRHIQLPDTGDDPTEINNLLNYEINQSFYLYSQKSKQSVDTLYMLAQDPATAGQLSELLGREIRQIPPPSDTVALPDDGEAFAVCRDFSALDLKKHIHPSISYKPLRKELTWRPFQWAGMAVGVCLIVLLAVEAGFLHHRQVGIQQRQSMMLQSASTQEPDLVFQELNQIVNNISNELGRPSGSDVMMRTLLSMPAKVSLQKITFDTSDAARLTIDASVEATHPAAFKAILDDFLSQVNQRFNLDQRPLREKDIRIGLERKAHNEREPLYRIHFSFELT
jgi:hypothetical protein